MCFFFFFFLGGGGVGYHHQTPILPFPTLPHLHPTPLHPYQSPLLHYPILLGYVRLGKDERYSGVVLGKDCFSKDVPLYYYENSLQLYCMSTVNEDLKL